MEDFFSAFNNVLNAIDGFIWGVPLMVLILFGGILLTVRLRGLQFSKLPRALRYMLKNEKGEDVAWIYFKGGEAERVNICGDTIITAIREILNCKRLKEM